MNRAVVTVATGRYIVGADRLYDRLKLFGERVQYWRGEIPPDSPPHSAVPYAFKAAALREASETFDVLLWADACIYPMRALDSLWQRIERDGYWIARNGWMNSQWTALDAYADLGITPQENAGVHHVVATTFGLSLRHPVGRSIFREYCRMALETKAFCGPWHNDLDTPCGGPEVLGHRHDQTALSVIAARAGCRLTESPDVFAYGKHTEIDQISDKTILLADGAY